MALVDPRLGDIIANAIGALPGYTYKITSGYRGYTPKNPGSFHGKGKAIDVALFDPSGRKLPNYQNASTFRTYERLAQAARAYQMQKYPELNTPFRWGGYFQNGGRGSYGNSDTMHFDIGGTPGLGMAGGSWAGGASPTMRAQYAGLQSQGMGAGGAATGGGALTSKSAAGGIGSDHVASLNPPPVADPNAGTAVAGGDTDPGVIMPEEDTSLAGMLANAVSGMSTGTRQAAPQNPDPVPPPDPLPDARARTAGLTPEQLAAPYFQNAQNRQLAQLGDLFTIKTIGGKGNRTAPTFA